jgi:hypothetical protein
LQVSYDGAPQFEIISGTPLERAVNTSKQVLRHNDYYYLCQDAAWYSSSSATGPWRPALEIPDAVYSIPKDDPAYNLTFVKLGSFDQETGRQAYVHTYGYSGTYTADKGLSKDGPQGSGKYYDPTYDPRQRDPNFWLNFGYGGYGGYGGYWPRYGYGARYYPHFGGYRYGGYYDPFWGYPYASYSSETVDLPDHDTQWISEETVQQRGLESDSSAAAQIYTGPDGQSYRMAEQGWQIQQGKKWAALTEPVPYSVTREYQARLAGYASYQRYVQEQAAQP